MPTVFIIFGVVAVLVVAVKAATAQNATTCDPCDPCGPSTDGAPVDDGTGGCENMPSDDFNATVDAIAERLQIDPAWLVACMKFESGLSPSIVNKFSGAVGLIQFLPRTAQALGVTVDELAGMSDVEQLTYVENYLQPYAGRMNNLGDVYMAIFWPRAIGENDDYVLFSSPSVAYTQNSGLDGNGDGTITRGEAYARVQRIYDEGAA